MENRKTELREKLLCALDESMKSIFGENTAQAVYYHLEKRDIMKPEDILEKPQTFALAIKDIFGETGAEIIETLLIKDLLTKLGVKKEREENTKLVTWLDKLNNCTH